MIVALIFTFLLGLAVSQLAVHYGPRSLFPDPPPVIKCQPGWHLVENYCYYKVESPIIPMDAMRCSSLHFYAQPLQYLDRDSTMALELYKLYNTKDNTIQSYHYQQLSEECYQMKPMADGRPGASRIPCTHATFPICRYYAHPEPLETDHI